MSLGTWHPHGAEAYSRDAYSSDLYGIAELSAGEPCSPVEDVAHNKPRRQGFALLCAIVLCCGLPIVGDWIGWSNIAAPLTMATASKLGAPEAVPHLSPRPASPLARKQRQRNQCRRRRRRTWQAFRPLGRKRPHRLRQRASLSRKRRPPVRQRSKQPARPMRHRPRQQPRLPDGPLPPPTVDPTDPYQAKALAVGLHPGLSRVLLRRLTKADYHNAGLAIRKAIAETPDTGVFIWPRQRKPDGALFRIHFVQGAAPTCRRYVVTVTKDGWSTTAPPMERCGVTTVAARH